jgi:hypothetical protein
MFGFWLRNWIIRRRFINHISWLSASFPRLRLSSHHREPSSERMAARRVPYAPLSPVPYILISVWYNFVVDYFVFNDKFNLWKSIHEGERVRLVGRGVSAFGKLPAYCFEAHCDNNNSQQSSLPDNDLYSWNYNKCERNVLLSCGAFEPLVLM